jgi:hypothetical protein
MRIGIILFLLSYSTFVNAQLLYKGGVSAAYNMQKNWNENQSSFITLQTGWLVDYRKDKKDAHTFHHLNTEVSYIYYPDSIWKTNTDYLKLNLLWSKVKTSKWENTTSLYFATRYLNKYSNNRFNNSWQEGFLNPMELSFSYGWKRTIMKKSLLSISLSTLQLMVTPASRVNTKNEATLQLKNNTVITGQYGLQAQCLINELFFSERLQWINDTRIYMNELSAKGFLMDVHNIAAIKVYKYLEIRIDAKLQYDYLISSKLRFKQEALLGFYYSNLNKKTTQD